MSHRGSLRAFERGLNEKGKYCFIQLLYLNDDYLTCGQKQLSELLKGYFRCTNVKSTWSGWGSNIKNSKSMSLVIQIKLRPNTIKGMSYNSLVRLFGCNKGSNTQLGI